ncbi:hypothetical protein GNI_136110 [Gregarina niphandrodes]|uniref:Uncharacterized protein n=1 Tax=Gregarina niphandrodes TaxID=110365 RepID=A0A023B1G9_GRENI|nr:hypothetical protein GNI_136110 [Gregarina niphandrodes]EZG45938.1 hypothetical protein GNI_136110 [Gregarina niphandrodes]|eukprot:XP_011132406.1 hypothetical protein GNI_136110 [Gregarina niphandrodes]
MTAITGTFESPMRNATMDDWNNLNWVACGDTGGRILCTVGEDPLSNLVGHYFSVPFEFGFPTVWRTIVRNLKPDTCSFQCHTRDETEHLLMIRRGMASAKWAGIDLKDASEDELYQLGRQAHNLTTLSQTTGDCFEVDFASLMRHPLPWKRRYTLYQVTGFHIPAVKFATDHRLSLKKTRYRHDDYDLFCHVFKDENDAKQKLQEFWKHERMLS